MSPRAAVDTRNLIVESALESLREDGFAGTSARTIARRGGFNQALIFYHFGTLDDLLLAALDRTSSERMQRYRSVLAEAKTLPDKIASATKLYREDLKSGHITVLSEMIAGSLSRPDLGPQIVERMEPWIDFAMEALREPLSATGLESVIPARTAAYAVVALYLGIDLLSHLEEDNARTEALLEVAGRLSETFGWMLDSGGCHENRH